MLKWLPVTHSSRSIVRKSLIDILDRLPEGEKVSEVANELGIGNSTMINV